MLSLGMFSFFAARTAVRKRGLEFGSPPPMRAAIVNSRIRRVNTRPRLASVAAFLCLIVAHFECPDMTLPSYGEIRLCPAGRGFVCGELQRAATPERCAPNLRPQRLQVQTLK